MRRAVIACVVLSCLLVAAPAARAGTLTSYGEILIFDAAPGEANVLDVRLEAPTVVAVRDTGAQISTALSNCVVILDTARCSAAVRPIDRIDVRAGDGDDAVTVADLRAFVEGGPGADTIRSGARRDVLAGGDGDDLLEAGLSVDELRGGGGSDRLFAGGDDDVLDGGPGNDHLDGGHGGDVLIGGPDADRIVGGGNGSPPPGHGQPVTTRYLDVVSYETRTAGVTVRLNAIADDGEPGEGDNVSSDVEEVRGGGGADTLQTADAPPSGERELYGLYGGPGNDLLLGRADADRLFGEDGDDTLRGGGSHDRLEGGAGQDLLEGGDDGDNLAGGPGSDRSFGGAGNDEFFGNDDGDDLVNGGSGQDLIYDAPGNDVIDGGDDHDTLRHVPGSGADHWYGGAGSDRWEGGDPWPGHLTIRLDGLSNDGVAGEGDNVHSDIESVHGSWRDDLLVGNDGGNSLSGGAGNDTLVGNGGFDFLFGDLGDDTLLARDGGADWLVCGDGTDTAEIDAGLEREIFDCETLLP